MAPRISSGSSSLSVRPFSRLMYGGTGPCHWRVVGSCQSDSQACQESPRSSLRNTLAGLVPAYSVPVVGCCTSDQMSLYVTPWLISCQVSPASSLRNRPARVVPAYSRLAFAQSTTTGARNPPVCSSPSLRLDVCPLAPRSTSNNPASVPAYQACVLIAPLAPSRRGRGHGPVSGPRRFAFDLECAQGDLLA